MGNRFLSAVVGAMVVGSGGANAAVVVDVDNLVLPPPGANATFGLAASDFKNTVQRDLFQTWTVTTPGVLNSVEFFGSARVQNGPSFTTALTVYKGDVRAPGAVALGHVSINSLDVPTYAVHSVDLSGLGVVTNSGDLMSLGLSVEDCAPLAECSFINWQRFFSGTVLSPGPLVATSYGYSGGAQFQSVNGVFVAPADANSDMNFRIFVDDGAPPSIAAVPEPTTWAAVLLGFFAIGGALRRRRRAVVA